MNAEQRTPVTPGHYICPFGYCLKIEGEQDDGMVLFARLLPKLEKYDEARSWLEASRRSGEWMEARGLRGGHDMRVAALQESDSDRRILRARLELRQAVKSAA